MYCTIYFVLFNTAVRPSTVLCFYLTWKKPLAIVLIYSAL